MRQKRHERQQATASLRIRYWVGRFIIPQVTINTGIMTAEGREESLTEYLCDQPGCPNIATHVLGCVREMGVVAAVCDEHAPGPRP